jgi:CHASE3 domain sensor protein
MSEAFKNPTVRPASPRLAGIFAVISVIIALSILFTYLAGMRVIYFQDKEKDQQADVRHLKNVLLTLVDAETGQRGFLLTGVSDYLEPYDSAQQRISGDLDALKGFESAEVNKLSQLTAIKLAELQRTIELYRAEGPIAAMKLMHTDIGKQAMKDIRELIADMLSREETCFPARRPAFMGWRRQCIMRPMSALPCSPSAGSSASVSWCGLSPRSRPRSSTRVSRRPASISSARFSRWR